MSLFDDNSAFYLDAANERRRSRGELDDLSPYDPIVDAGQRQSYNRQPSIPEDQLERWYATLNDEAERVTQEGRTRQAADSTQASLRMVADEIYSYLR